MVMCATTAVSGLEYTSSVGATHPTLAKAATGVVSALYTPSRRLLLLLCACYTGRNNAKNIQSVRFNCAFVCASNLREHRPCLTCMVGKLDGVHGVDVEA